MAAMDFVTKAQIGPGAVGNVRSVVIRDLAIIGIAFAGLCVAAQVRVPVPGSPVPMTLQSLVVILIGLSLPASVAFAATTAYVVGGTLGLPILTNPAGLWGETGGYLAGFVVAAPMMAWLRGPRTSSYGRLFAVSMMGLAVVFAMGAIWQTVGFAGNLRAALAVGFLPFAGKALLEALLAPGLVRACRVGKV